MYRVAVLKILNVSERTGMSVVPRRNEICEMQISQPKNVHGRSFWARMSVVPRKGDVFAQRKLVVEKCTRMYTFQQACG